MNTHTLPTLAVKDGHPVATSLQVAEHFDKRHKNVMQSIQNLECSKEFSELNFQPAEYIDEQGKPRPMYEMTRDGFMFLCMGFTGAKAAQWKEWYITAFNQMEAALQQREMVALPTTPYQLAQLLNGSITVTGWEALPIARKYKDVVREVSPDKEAKIRKLHADGRDLTEISIHTSTRYAVVKAVLEGTA